MAESRRYNPRFPSRMAQAILRRATEYRPRVYRVHIAHTPLTANPEDHRYVVTLRPHILRFSLRTPFGFLI
ncbi:MAG: hypothetical protein LBK73_09530 [Treponema sp.]|nr:hypothetical protein [Treponema sp.]